MFLFTPFCETQTQSMFFKFELGKKVGFFDFKLDFEFAALHFTRNTKFFHFILLHPLNLICIQESNLNLSSSVRIPGYFALGSDRTHFALFRRMAEPTPSPFPFFPPPKIY